MENITETVRLAAELELTKGTMVKIFGVVVAANLFTYLSLAAANVKIKRSLKAQES